MLDRRWVGKAAWQMPSGFHQLWRAAHKHLPRIGVCWKHLKEFIFQQHFTLSRINIARDKDSFLGWWNMIVLWKWCIQEEDASYITICTHPHLPRCIYWVLYMQSLEGTFSFLSRIKVLPFYSCKQERGKLSQEKVDKNSDSLWTSCLQKEVTMNNQVKGYARKVQYKIIKIKLKHHRKLLFQSNHKDKVIYWKHARHHSVWFFCTFMVFQK